MNKNYFWGLVAFFFLHVYSLHAQSTDAQLAGQNKVIAFTSDTQEPMWVEKRIYRSNHNRQATRLIFNELAARHYASLFILGDVVALGYQEKKWKKMDAYLDACRSQGTPVYALLGNHEVMGKPRKGEKAFQKRFPDHVRTGYYEIVDSIAVILLNSNFIQLSEKDIQRQQTFYESTIKQLNDDPAVLSIIVCCHHSPFSNSKAVGSSLAVQEHFVPLFIKTPKCRVFISGHAHAFEHFKKQGKDFLVIGGGGGIHQPLKTEPEDHPDLAHDYKPMFHYLTLLRAGSELSFTSHFLKADFSGFENGYQLISSHCY